MGHRGRRCLLYGRRAVPPFGAPRHLKEEHMRKAAMSLPLLVALLVGGCASSDAGTTANTQTGGFEAYRDCLAANGVTITMPSRDPGAFPSDRPTDFPSGGPGGGQGPGGFGGGLGGRPEGVDEETWQKAQDACASVRPTGGPGGTGPGGGQGGGGNAGAAYRNCLNENGVTPENQNSTDDPVVAAAMTKCAPLRPSAPAATPTP
jgi:hypothetical protein